MEQNCTECQKRTTCKSWYGGCGCTEAPVTVFGTQDNRKKLVIDEDNKQNSYFIYRIYLTMVSN